MYTIEFQPSGLRLILDEPVTLLDAARRAGVLLRADCGGKGLRKMQSSADVKPPEYRLQN